MLSDGCLIRLMDLVEEVWDMSCLLNASFLHVKRSANSKVDSPVKEWIDEVCASLIRICLFSCNL